MIGSRIAFVYPGVWFDAMVKKKNRGPSEDDALFIVCIYAASLIKIPFAGRWQFE